MYLYFSEGSIVADYRVSWNKNIAEPPISAEELNSTMTTYLEKNNNYLYTYFVPTSTITVAKVKDACAMHTLR